jgi:hypothetical protein
MLKSNISDFQHVKVKSRKINEKKQNTRGVYNDFTTQGLFLIPI